MRVVLAVIVLFAFFYGMYVLTLEIGRTEGDSPAATSLQVPAGTEVVTSDVQCASGGCWSWLELEPPEGMSPASLAESLGATPDAQIRGWILNPRTTYVHAVPGDEVLGVSLSYWSENGHPPPPDWR